MISTKLFNNNLSWKDSAPYHVNAMELKFKESNDRILS